MSHKIIQWATGAIGKTSLRQVIDHPDLDLVGLLVHSDSKAGKDAGEIARRPHTGVIATQSADEIIALDADVVLHLPLNAGTVEMHDETIKQLLRSGKNVITTVAHTFPQAIGPDYAAGFEAACREGNATLLGTGINPGFMTERLAVALTSVCTRIDNIRTTEIYDVSEVRSPGFIFDLMGIGRAPETFADVTGVQRVFQHIFGAEVTGYVGHVLQVDFDEVVADHEFGTADHDIQLPAGVVKAGGVVNFRWRWHGIKDGKPFLTIEMLWLADSSLDGWDYSDGWNINITGAPGITARIDLVEPDNMPDRSRAMQYAVAGPVIRAIPEVVKAPPGILIPPVFAPYTPRMRA